MTHPDLSWIDGDTPVATAFDDPYFTGGLEETRHVFLQGNDLPARLKDGFRVAELGFGTGLNLLALAQAWDGPGIVHFTSFEAFPMAPADMARALKPFAQPMAEALVAGWAAAEGSVRRFRLGQVEAEIRIGDARQVLPVWDDKADAWFLDGFAPARTPELWDDGLMAEVARHTRPGGTFATYPAAGHVRRALEQAGFAVSRVPGFGRKKHMSIGRIPG
ncbi:tRNA (5-methylaminomethyl-2-thiouridine)(34)-methyltransferase MnmD [Pararhodobacter marinus]|uniref:tRNA (5-methylaminomethyl-2-thiouridine)(34)-methyltransferase MnmD n=1 Tax=Pararhodobacter marinus TaxID=2184063 RepID=UPI003517B220